MFHILETFTHLPPVFRYKTILDYLCFSHFLKCFHVILIKSLLKQQEKFVFVIKKYYIHVKGNKSRIIYKCPVKITYSPISPTPPHPQV